MSSTVDASVLLQREAPALRLDEASFARLRERLRWANRGNDQFEAQCDRLMDVLELVLRRLERGFGEAIERVLAVGEWAREGIDLRSLPYEEVVIQIVLRGDERPLSLYWQIADQAFAELADEDILVQFTLETLPEWQHAATLARMEGQDDLLGVQLLTRA